MRDVAAKAHISLRFSILLNLRLAYEDSHFPPKVEKKVKIIEKDLIFETAETSLPSAANADGIRRIQQYKTAARNPDGRNIKSLI